MSKRKTLRLRVFAGPNGSGKSTIIQKVRDYKVAGVPVDFGIYINADDLAAVLRKKALDFSDYSLLGDKEEFIAHALQSGLINDTFTEEQFREVCDIRGRKLYLSDSKYVDRVAQICADYLRNGLLLRESKFSFETVFSHRSKIEFMKNAAERGYKVYFYFVSTESPDINKDRVAIRVKKGGHNVPEHLIESRYFRSLDNLYEAAQYAYQAFFFDNSGDEPTLFAHFKVGRNGKEWHIPEINKVPHWFVQYYSNKVRS